MTKGRIPIKAAEGLSKQYRCPMVIIYGLHDNGERFTVTTYGQSKKLCRHAADIGRKIAKAILNGDVTPAEKEPMDLPDEPSIFRSV